MREALRELAGSIVRLALRICGVALALAPSRLWPSLDAHVPVTSSALASGVITFLCAAAIGIPGFLAYGTNQADLNNRVFLEMAVRPEAVGRLDSRAMTAMNGLAFFTFLFLTPSGWATMYLGGSGFLRALTAAFGDGMGDPLLTAADAAVLGMTRRRRARRARAEREALEGPEVRDQVVAGASIGLPDADFVIVSARRKPGWDRGTVVISGEKFYRVGEIVERTIRGRLRTLYPLTEHTDLEVIRRSVHYDIPELRARPQTTAPRDRAGLP